MPFNYEREVRAKAAFSHPAHRSVSRWPEQAFRSSDSKTAYTCMALWLLIWCGYNSGPWYVLHPNFPSSSLELIHGVRAFFPILAGWLSILYLLAQPKMRPWVFEGPVGLMLFYAAVGALSSMLLSTAWFEALYWDFAFGSVALAAMVALSNDSPVETASSLLTLSGIIAAVMTIGIMLGMPLIGGPSVLQSDPLTIQTIGEGYKTANFLGMAGTRNTGFARYAAVAGLCSLGRLWCGKPLSRLIWLGVLMVSAYCLAIAQGRSEIVGFVVGSLIILMLRRSRRPILVVWGIGLLVLMWFGHFFDRLWDYGTRTGHFDPSLTGRTATWHEGWQLFKQSPWVGFGFQADRYFLQGQHMHDALLHALVQTGLLGTAAFVLAIVLSIFLMVKLYVASQLQRSAVFRDEVAGILVFFIILSVTESTAYFSADWLLLAPVLTYIQALAWQNGLLTRRARYARRPTARLDGHAMAVPPSQTSGGDLPACLQ